MYFIAIKTVNGYKAVNRTLYPREVDAEYEIMFNHARSASELVVMDADHPPDSDVLKARHGFA